MKTFYYYLAIVVCIVLLALSIVGIVLTIVVQPLDMIATAVITAALLGAMLTYTLALCTLFDL